jgi:hypothetical protein
MHKKCRGIPTFCLLKLLLTILELPVRGHNLNIVVRKKGDVTPDIVQKQTEQVFGIRLDLRQCQDLWLLEEKLLSQHGVENGVIKPLSFEWRMPLKT